MLIDLRNSNKGFHVQAYADDVAILVTDTVMLGIEGRAQKAVNIATNYASTQDIQFSSKMTETVLLTNKRKSVFGHQLVISKEARLREVTHGSKVTWRTLIVRTARKTTAA